MSAVIRVKRRIDEEPLNAFILNCKRPKLDDNPTECLLATKDEVSTIVKFAATVQSQDETTALQIAKLTKDEARQLAKKTPRDPEIAERSRQEMRANTQENRFKVVNCYRAVKSGEDDVSGTETKEVTIVDVEKQSGISENCQSADAVATEESASTSIARSTSNPNGQDNFVYDLYLAESTQPGDNANLVENYFSVRPFDDLIYEDRSDNELSDTSDSNDSNQENYFRNDYPDTEEGSSVGESDMRVIMQDIDINSSYELSSDEDCNGFVYSVDSEAIGFEDDIDYCDVNRYGEAYARYRGKSVNRDPTYNDNESDCSDYYESDD